MVAGVVKVRIIQAMFQIERPMGFTKENIKRLAHELKNRNIEFCYM